MLPQVLRACIVDEFGEYKTLFEELVATSEPDGGVMLQASASKSPYFKLRLDQRVAELGYVTEVDEGWKRDTEHNNIVIDNDVPSRDTMLIPHMGQNHCTAMAIAALVTKWILCYLSQRSGALSTTLETPVIVLTSATTSDGHRGILKK